MPESLLNQSRILLFGQRIVDLRIVPHLPEGAIEVRAATVDESDRNDEGNEDGIPVVADETVLVKDQENERQNGIHTVVAGGAWDRVTDTPNGSVIYVSEGVVNGGSLWVLTRRPPEGGGNPRYSAEPYVRSAGDGANRQLADQFLGAGFAKIYGFSYEGRYYDLARPTLFMVHGDGDQITEDDAGPAASNNARAPRKPGDIGLSVADFQFSDEMRVWAYDKADYTIRMDVEAGMFEQVVLDAELVSDEMLTSVSGAHARVSGAHARVSGAHARVSGAHARIRGNRGGD